MCREIPCLMSAVVGRMVVDIHLAARPRDISFVKVCGQGLMLSTVPETSLIAVTASAWDPRQFGLEPRLAVDRHADGIPFVCSSHICDVPRARPIRARSIHLAANIERPYGNERSFA